MPDFDHMRTEPPGESMYQNFAGYRKTAPVRYDEPTNRWVLSRAGDIRRAATDGACFSNKSTFGLHPRVFELMGEFFPHGLPDRAPTLLNSDPPEHTMRRRLLKGVFTPAEVARRRAMITTIADELIGSFIDQGHADLANDYAQRLSALVIGTILGLRPEFSTRLASYIDARLSLYRHDLTDEQITSALRLHKEFCDGLSEHIDDRRRHPRDDLLTEIITAWPTLTEQGVPAEDSELFALVNGIALGGQETTANLIAIALHEAARQPGLMQRLTDDPILVEHLIEETLRYRSPVIGTNRTTRCPVTVHGTTIPAGSRVQLLWASANHDEATGDDLDTLVIDREARPSHFSFGAGPHYCIGAPLARLEATIAVTRILSRLPHLRLVEPDSTPYVISPIVYGPARLLAQWAAP
jgi:cytochrome P450